MAEQGRRGGKGAPPPGRRAPARPGPSPAVRRALRRGPAYQKPRLVLGPLNYGLLAAAAAAIVVGFVLLDAGETSLAPFLLVVGYCILVPAALLVERVPGRGAGSGPGAGSPGGE